MSNTSASRNQCAQYSDIQASDINISRKSMAVDSIEVSPLTDAKPRSSVTVGNGEIMVEWIAASVRTF